MRITASHILEWANTKAKEAQTNLPRLIRRLCFDAIATRQLSFPAGDSTYVPGWDGDDGVWPFSPAREVLDRPDMEEMRTGFVIGIHNKRGVTSRSPWDGGNQERDLAGSYRSQAVRVQYSHPNMAAALEKIAKSYEREGTREDVDASLRKEGY